MKLLIKPSVGKDLKAIAEFIAEDNPDRAVTYAAELANKVRSLKDNAKLYPKRPQWGRDTRSLVHGSYHILYKIRRDRVVVLRILHGARNIKQIIEEDT